MRQPVRHARFWIGIDSTATVQGCGFARLRFGIPLDEKALHALTDPAGGLIVVVNTDSQIPAASHHRGVARSMRDRMCATASRGHRFIGCVSPYGAVNTVCLLEAASSPTGDRRRSVCCERTAASLLLGLKLRI